MHFTCLQTPETRTNKEIEKNIANWMKDYEKATKLLLLGAGESGKTTIIKQMKILHISGFSVEEQREKTAEIRKNVVESMVTLCTNMTNVGCELAEVGNQEALNYVLQYGEQILTQSQDINELLNEQFYDSVSKLWQDAGIQSTYSKQNNFQLIDCAKYFLDKVDTIRQSSYVPSVQDILNSRKMTTDIQKIEFEAPIQKRYGGGTQRFWMFDVGGQKGERKKWIQVFDGIQAVLFLVASNCFDLRSREDESLNRLEDSLDIFENVWTSRFLQSAGLILFLNKQDKLREKVVDEKISIAENFPAYNNFVLAAKDEAPGEDVEYLKTRCFIRELFLDITRAPSSMNNQQQRRPSIAPALTVAGGQKRECYAHFTTATDTNNVKLVFEDVHNMIILSAMAEIGIY